MIWLTVHMWFLLIAAFAIGLGAGWWIWGARAGDSTLPVQKDDNVTLGSLDADSSEQVEKDSVR